MNINTCDLLLCSGNGILSTTIIAMNKIQEIKKTIRNGTLIKKWVMDQFETDLSLQLSHLALAVNITEAELEGNAHLWHHIPKSGLYVFESTTGNAEWSGVSGVQINPYHKWLGNYDGRVWLRNLQPVTRPKNTKVITDMVNMIGTPYEDGIPGLLELALTFNPDIRIDTPEVHCTEAGVIINKSCGLFKPETDAHKMPPCKFGDGREIEQLVNCEISDMIELK